jgi:hypothetical protein
LPGQRADGENTNAMKCTGYAPLLPAALSLAALGLSVIPLRPADKKPAIRWKRFQDERADQETIRTWFADTDTGQFGIGVVLGAVSGGVMVRDFDAKATYRTFAKRCPELARTCPTVETARGCHVYFRATGRDTSTRKAEGGELRGDGSFVVCPPSLHPSSGLPYRWTHEPQDRFPVAPAEALLDSREPPFTKQGRPKNQTQVVLRGSCRLPAGEVLAVLREDRPLAAVLPELIRSTLPSKTGERNLKLYEFARALKTFAETKNCSAADLERYVRAWHEAALPFIGTKDVQTCLDDFARAWPNIRYGFGAASLDVAAARAREASTPAAAMKLCKPEQRMLATLCRELQRINGTEPLYLQCRDAAEIIGIGRGKYEKAWRWLRFALPAAGILEHVSSGSLAAGLSNEYRYLPPLDE